MCLVAALRETSWADDMVAGIAISKGQSAKCVPVAGNARPVAIGMHVTLAMRWIMDIHTS